VASIHPPSQSASGCGCLLLDAEDTVHDIICQQKDEAQLRSLLLTTKAKVCSLPSNARHNCSLREMKEYCLVASTTSADSDSCGSRHKRHWAHDASQ
jgi:hypothetical protein